MAIKHSKTSAKADGGDATLVQPSDWNANHTIDNATVTYAMIQNVSATSRVLGRITAGAGTVEELTAANLKTILGLTAGDVSGLATIATSGSGADLTGASVAYAKIQNVSATQRLLGRNTAGAGVTEEVTASQLLDWVSSTNGVLLTRTAGSWAAAANVGISGGDLLLTAQASPSTPASGKLAVYDVDMAGRQLLTELAPVGAASPLQAAIAHKSIATWQPAGASTTMTVLGTPTPTATGTVTARNPANTSLFTSLKRIGYVSAATANSVGGLRDTAAQYWLGNASGLGGFYVVIRFGNSDASLVSTGRTFVGLWSTTTAPTDVDPSTLTNILGVGNNNGDTNMQLYASGAVAQARTDLGASFPANTVTTDAYELTIFAQPNASSVGWRLARLGTANVTSGTVTGANLFANTTFVTIQIWRGNGGTASAVGIDLMSMYAESDY